MFSVFYTQKFDDNPALISKGRIFSYLEFKNLVFLKMEEFKNVNAPYFALPFEDNFSFIINFYAALFAKKHVILLNDFKTLKELDLESFVPSEISFDLKNVSTERVFSEISLDDTKVTLYTSGTTGKPKKLVKTLSNIIAEANDMIFDLCINKEDVYGEPGVGRRFKGTIWMQGYINFPN